MIALHVVHYCHSYYCCAEVPKHCSSAAVAFLPPGVEHLVATSELAEQAMQFRSDFAAFEMRIESFESGMLSARHCMHVRHVVKSG